MIIQCMCLAAYHCLDPALLKKKKLQLITYSYTEHHQTFVYKFNVAPVEVIYCQPKFNYYFSTFFSFYSAEAGNYSFCICEGKSTSSDGRYLGR